MYIYAASMKNEKLFISIDQILSNSIMWNHFHQSKKLETFLINYEFFSRNQN